MTSDGKRRYAYDAKDRLTAVTEDDDDNITFTYDSLGRRTSMTEDGKKITKYLYQGNTFKVAKEIRPDGEELTFSYDKDGNPLTMKYKGQVYYYLYNGHNDVVGLTDAKGVKIAEYTYDPWGKVIKVKGAEGEGEDDEEDGETDDGEDIAKLNPYRYAGYRYDDETKLYYLQTRYYNPTLGRFISQDKWDGETDQPASQNKYVYAYNNPVNYIDPTGESPWGFIKGFANAAFGISEMVRDVKILTNKNTSTWDKVKAGARLTLNVASAVATFTPVGAVAKLGRAAKVVNYLNKANSLRRQTEGTYQSLKGARDSLRTLTSKDKRISNKERMAALGKLALTAGGMTFGKFPGKHPLSGKLGFAAKNGSVGKAKAALKKIDRQALNRGRASEKAVLAKLRLQKNTKKVIGIVEGKRVKTIPDYLTKKKLGEIKDVKKLSLTRQIKAQISYARSKGLTYNLHVRRDTKLSKKLVDTVLKAGGKINKNVGTNRSVRSNSSRSSSLKSSGSRSGGSKSSSSRSGRSGRKR